MNNLKMLRKANKMSLRELGELANMPHSLINEIEKGNRKMNARHAALLAPIFGVTEVYLMGDDAIRLDMPLKDFLKDFLDSTFDELINASVDGRLDSSTKLIYTLVHLLSSTSFSDEELKIIIDFVEKLKGDR